MTSINSVVSTLDEHGVACPAPASPHQAKPYMTGNFAPIESETTSFDLEVVGRVPEELSGRFLRIGPNPVGPIDPMRFHWFTGAGMAHGLRLRDGQAKWYRSRFVRSASVAAVLGREPLPGPGKGVRDGNVNTNFTSAAGKVYALVEAGGLPVELDEELESITRCDFGGTLEAGFAAHPKFDPVTGLQHAIAYEPGQPVRYITLDPSGRATTVARINLPHNPMIHDVAFTESSIVVLDLPATFQPRRATTAFPWLWDDRQAARVGLLPRNGDVASMRWFDAPRCFVFHFLNAYDQGDQTIVDVVRHPRMFDIDQAFPNEGTPVLARWTMDRKSGRFSETILDDRGCEFPRINGAVAGRPYRFGYTAQLLQTDTFGPAMKHDLAHQTSESHDYGSGRVTMEPVFVPRPGNDGGGGAEDDGWIMSYVYDSARDRSDVVILDARNFGGEPVATIRLPVRVPFGFHGGWVSDRSGVPPVA